MIKHRGNRRAKGLAGRRGAAVVEFALIAPILLLLFGAAADLATAVERSIRLQSIARAGATYAAVVPSDTNNSAATVMNALASDLPGASSSLAISCACPASTASSTGPIVSCDTICPTGMATYITVVVSAPFTSFFPLGSSIGFSSIGATSARITLRVS